MWKIDEGPDEDNKPLITGKIIMAIQIVGDKESYHPRICWHSHKQVRLSLKFVRSYLIQLWLLTRSSNFS